MSTADLVASFASGSTEVMSSFGMGCEIGEGLDSPDSPSNKFSVMSPVEAARLVSAEFFAEQEGAALDCTSDEGSGRRSAKSTYNFTDLSSIQYTNAQYLLNCI